MTTLYTNTYFQQNTANEVPTWMKGERFDYCEKAARKSSFLFIKKSK